MLGKALRYHLRSTIACEILKDNTKEVWSDLVVKTWRVLENGAQCTHKTYLQFFSRHLMSDVRLIDEKTEPLEPVDHRRAES